MRLSDELNGLKNYPFHMPGHKRNPKFGIIGSEIDVTEIHALDDLHNPRGILLEVENKLASIYKSKKSFMLVNGSTVGILSAIFALCSDGDKIIIARNCHKSVYNACLLRRLKVVYLEPEFDYTDGYYTGIRQSSVDETIRKNPNAKAVVITSPTYEGNVSNVRCNIPLIIDCAHGAHFGLGNFPSYPQGDIVISSLHKTLPALTQTAVANVYNERYISKFKFYLDMFESSSPSYVLMDSVAKCCEFIENNKKDFYGYYDMLCKFRGISLFRLRLKYSDDYSKIVVSTAGTSISGVELAEMLRSKYGIEVEMASDRYIIAMTSVGDSGEGFDKLEKALLEIDSALILKEQKPLKKPPVPRGAHIITVDDDGVFVDIKKSAGRISNEFVYAYPPDIPILAPNEEITKEALEYILRAESLGVNILSNSGMLPNKLLTKADR